MRHVVILVNDTNNDIETCVCMSDPGYEKIRKIYLSRGCQLIDSKDVGGIQVATFREATA